MTSRPRPRLPVPTGANPLSARFARAARTGLRQLGYTLVELMTVIGLIALGSALVALAYADTGQAALDRDGRRLAAMLDGARAQSRLLGRQVVWQPVPGGFGFRGLAPGIAVSAWLTPEVRAVDPPQLVLGPEPMTRPQSVTLVLGEHQLRLNSDGLAPFAP